MEESTITNEDKENSPPEETTRAGAVRKKVASFPEGEGYELLLMDIVDRNSAHIPPRGKIGKYWTKVVADFNATTGPNISKLNDWRPVSRKYTQIRCNAENFFKAVREGTVAEESISETMTKAYNIANDHLLEENGVRVEERAAKRKIREDAANQVEEGRALRLKTATRIVAGEVVQVGGPVMVLGDRGEVVNLDSDEDSAVGHVMATPAGKKIRRTNSSDVPGGSSGTSAANNNKSMCRDLINSMAQARQLNLDIEAKRLDFEKQQAEKKETMEFHRIELEKATSEQKHEIELKQLEVDREERRHQRFELEKEDRQCQHEIMLQNIELQKMQMELQLADNKSRLAHI